jgi:hypothetical protein
VPDFDIDAPELEICGWHLRHSAVRRLRADADAEAVADIRRIEAIGNTPKSKRERYFEIGQLVRVLRDRSRTSRPASNDLTQPAESVLG